MPRIVYVLMSDGGIAGGHKMILRHVETLRDLGFDAVCYIGAQSKTPAWLSHKVPLELGTPVRPDDILVIPDDATEALGLTQKTQLRTVIFSQNPYYFASTSFDVVGQYAADRLPVFISVGRRLAATIGRAFPQARVELVPCFADERVFRPADSKSPTVAFAPRKRPREAKAIRGFFRRLHPEHAELGWRELLNATETEVAQGLSSASLFLSLSRLESVGMTTLEAIASGCVCAGFTGVGGWEYATDDNGFWVPEDDCEAAADAVARAADLVRTGGAPLKHCLDASRETASQWSYATFRAALEEVWMRLAPEARLREGPLDPAA
jgi:glycosyltransferase involved in cell wall biosynthesis